MNNTEAMIHWDLTRFYPSLGSEEYRSDKRRLSVALNELEKNLGDIPEFSQASLDAWAKHLCRLEELEAQYVHQWFYTLCQLATRGNDEKCVYEHNVMLAIRADLQRVTSTITTPLCDVDDELFSQLVMHPLLEGVGHTLDRFRQMARHSLSEEHEALATALLDSSFTSWGMLRNTIANKLEFTMDWPDGRTEQLPVGRQFDLMSSSDNRVRDAAAVGINKAWESQQDTIAACFNGIAGTRTAINKFRGDEDPLAETLRDAAISYETLSAMQSAVADSKAVWWRYLELKAKLLGKEKLAIHDRLALLPLDVPDDYSPTDAVGLILTAFDKTLPDLADYTRMAINSGCVEYATGPGYSGTGMVGFAAHSPVLKETCVYAEYHGSLVDINILAHELGHGYHSQLVCKLRHWQADYPPTLAESASTVAEGIFRQQMIHDSANSIDLRLQMLSLQMDAAVNYLLRIPRDFEFEHAFYLERAKGELNTSQIKTLMAQTHDRWFGDSLDPDFKDELHWASRNYFCSTNGSFINYPYTFGYLFSAALLHRVLGEGRAFDEPYRKLLLDTGSMSAEALARKHLDVDLTKSDFWLGEIRQLAEQLDLYESLARQCFPEKF